MKVLQKCPFICLILGKMPLNAGSIFHGMQFFLLVHGGFTNSMNTKCWKMDLISKLSWYPEKNNSLGYECDFP